MAVALAASLDPARLAVRLDTTGVPAGADTYTITRTSPSGHTADVRGASGAPVGIPTQITRDYEAPFDLALSYRVTVYDAGVSVGTATATITVAWDDCDCWLVDLARPTNSLPVTVESMRELTFDAASGVHRVLNRRAPVLTTLPAWTPSSELIVLTDTEPDRDRVRALLGSGYPFLLRSSPELGIGNMYLGATGFVEERLLTLGARPERRFRVACLQVERPDPSIFTPVPPNLYSQVQTTYATYAALTAAVASYDALAYSYPAEGSAYLPWLPDDV